MKKFLLVIMIIAFIVIDGYTGLLVLDDMIFYTTTIEVTKENEDIVESIKEHFDIDYEIKKIVYAPGFPDGYGLDLYDKDGVKHSYLDFYNEE